MLARSLALLVPLCACSPAVTTGGGFDGSCIPDWPEECLGAQGTTGATLDAPYECTPAPSLEADQRSVYLCLPRPETDDCPAVDSDCVADAIERVVIVDCRDCLREEVQASCGPDPDEADACCYRLVITSASCE